jgi:acetoin utilization deacetylase AcuC-like enzyme
MMCSAETYRLMTRQVMEVTDGKLVAAHEGGYSELYVPFCGHAMLEEMAGSARRAADPLAARISDQQPCDRTDSFHRATVDRLREELAAAGVL